MHTSVPYAHKGCIWHMDFITSPRGLCVRLMAFAITKVKCFQIHLQIFHYYYHYTHLLAALALLLFYANVFCDFVT